MTIPNREALKIDGAKVKRTLEKMQEKDKLWSSIERIGKGTTTGQYSISVSEDISLPNLKKNAKSKGLSVHELFNTAVILA